MEGLVTVNTGTRDKALEHRKSYSTALALFVPGIPHPSAKDAKQQGLFSPGKLVLGEVICLGPQRCKEAGGADYGSHLFIP